MERTLEKQQQQDFLLVICVSVVWVPGEARGSPGFLGARSAGGSESLGVGAGVAMGAKGLSIARNRAAPL